MITVNRMKRKSLISVYCINDKITHSVLIENNKKIKDLKLILAKRILDTPNNIHLYSSMGMNDLYLDEENIQNKRMFYMYIDYYEEPLKRYSWFRYYFCCGR